MDTEASKCVMYSKLFYQFQTCFDHNCAILESNFKLLTERYYLPWVLLMYIYGKEADFITYAWTGRIWFNANKHCEPKQCLGIAAMQKAIFEQFTELNLNR